MVCKHIFVIFGALVFFFCIPNTVPAQGGRIEMDFGKETISVNIKDARLRSVIERIKEERGTWFKLWLKGNESVLEETISLEFDSLSVKEGLERIFYPLNHCLIFDQNDKLLGVVLFGKPEPRRHSVKRRRVTPRRSPRRFKRR